jgi:hypothetical protein
VEGIVFRPSAIAPCNFSCDQILPTIQSPAPTQTPAENYYPRLFYEAHRITDKCIQEGYNRYKIDNGTWYKQTVPDYKLIERFDSVELGKEYVIQFVSLNGYTDIKYIYNTAEARNYCDVREQVYGEQCD